MQYETCSIMDNAYIYIQYTPSPYIYIYNMSSEFERAGRSTRRRGLKDGLRTPPARALCSCAFRSAVQILIFVVATSLGDFLGVGSSILHHDSA